MAQIYLIGGPNGAGKTTSAMKLLPDFLAINEFVNADTIAQGLSAFNSASISITAGKVMLNRITELISEKKNFAFETTMASRMFIEVLKSAKQKGYTVHLLYIWLRSAELAIERVSARVQSGGHSVEEEIIRRRYESGKKNFVSLYMPIAHAWTIFDNSGNEIRLIARKIINNELEILDSKIFNKIMEMN